MSKTIVKPFLIWFACVLGLVRLTIQLEARRETIAMVCDPAINARELSQKYPFTLESMHIELARSNTWNDEDDGNVARWAPFYVGDCGDEVGIAISEGWRLIYGLYDSDVPRVPVDLFCYELNDGPDIALPVTKTGGRPWRPDDRPWPRREDGQPLAFIGQIRMTESLDLVPERVRKAVGELVLVFSDYTEPPFPQYGQNWATMSVMEWSSLSDAPSGRPLATEFEAVLYAYSFRAHRCRTVEFDREAGCEYVSRMKGELLKATITDWPHPLHILQYNGTKIGGNPQRPYYYGSRECFNHCMQKGKHPPPRLIDAHWFASLGSISPDSLESFANGSHISWGDGGHINLYVEADGQMHGEECGQG